MNEQTTTPNETWLLDRCDAYFERFDVMPDCATKREFLIALDRGVLGSVFRDMALLEWNRRN